MNKTTNVVVIGGGYTGMVAALRLAQQGKTVTILEKGHALGGLASDFTIEGASLERAYHHLFKTDTSIINMAAELGIADKLQWHNSAVATYYKGTLYPFMTPMDLLKFTPLSFINRIRAGLVVFYLQRTNNWQRLEDISAYHWMKKYAGRQVTEVIWEPLLRGKFDSYYDKVSMAWLWARVHIRANSREPGDDGEKLGYFAGGFQTFTDALTAALKKHNVTIRTGVNLTGILSHQDHVELRFDDGHTEHYDQCLATTPSYIFAHLIKEDQSATPEYHAMLTTTKYLGALLMIFSSTQKISDYYWHNINDNNVPFLVFIHHTKLIDPKNYGGKYVYYIATYLGTENPQYVMHDDELEESWFKALKKIFPDFDANQIRQKHIFRFANAQHIVDSGYRQRIPSHKTPLKNVYLANFAQIYPEDRGTNYAVRDGEEVAKIM